jgi:hypothetical protein
LAAPSIERVEERPGLERRRAVFAAGRPPPKRPDALEIRRARAEGSEIFDIDARR